MTRRLVDASQNIIVRENDCGTLHFDEVDRNNAKTLFGDTFENKIYGKFTAKDVVSADGVVIAPANTLVDKVVLKDIMDSSATIVCVRSVLTCETEEGVCQKCYGLDLASSRMANIGIPVGIIAAQSIGEPGTQLTMRTFHSG